MIRSGSVSEQMSARFERRKSWRHLVALVYVAMSTTYLGWRLTIINPESLPLSIAFYAVECIGFLLGLKSILGSWSYSHRTPPPAPPGLAVDVLLPVYQEPVEIIRRTVMAARAIRYPHRTVMLDDGKRDELEALAAELGVDYLRRPDNLGAKAGNLNFGLQHSAATFVMVLDADHIAMPHALDIMLGFFQDDRVALVQTPQDYYNVDAFQYVNSRHGALWHDQSAFYNLSQPCADLVNAAECVGTGVVYRRSALDAIGGIPTETVTEDTHTSLRLHKAGLTTVYLNEPIAYGLAAADLGEYYKTRHRWGHGNLQVLRCEKVLTCRGLTPAQRIHYSLMGLIYLEGWQQLLLLLLPVFTLVLGLPSFNVTLFNVTLIMAFPVASYLLLQELGCGFARYWANEIFSMARWPIYIAASLGIFGGSMRFRSSLKSARGRISWYLMAPQLTMLALSLFSVIYGYLRLAETGFQMGPLSGLLIDFWKDFHLPHVDWHALVPYGFTVDLYAVSAVWALYGAIRAACFVRKAIHGAARSHDFFRFKVPVPVRLEGGAYGCLIQLAEDWVELRIDQAVVKNSQLTFSAFTPAGPQVLRMTVTTTSDGICSGPLCWTSSAARDAWAAGLYSVDWHREFLHRNADFMVPSDVPLALLRPRPTRMQWHAVLLGNTRESCIHYSILSEPDRPETPSSLITFIPLVEGELHEVMIFRPNGIVKAHLAIGSITGLHTLASAGLDGAIPRRCEAKIIH